MTSEAARGLLARIDAVEMRLQELSLSPTPRGLTDPDPQDEERWDWGQVWAHTAEFPAYWIEQIRLALANPGAEPPSFGRTKSDAGRIGAIERDRSAPVQDLMERLREDLGALRLLVEGLGEEDWRFRVRHQSLGVMDLPRAFEEFLIGHLEAHADQLERLRAEDSPDSQD